MKKLVAFTGSRAELFIQAPLFKALDEEPNIQLDIIVSYQDTTTRELLLSTLSKHGLTIRHQIHCQTSSELHSHRIAYILNSLIELDLSCYDAGIAYADRFETFAFAIALSQSGLPIIHVEAGDHTLGGTYDDTVRHAISSLSAAYITTNSYATKRLLKYGYHSSRIHQAGSFNIIKNIGNELALNFFPDALVYDAVLVLTYHPLPLNKDLQHCDLLALSHALSLINSEYKYRLVITGVNGDEGSSFVDSFLSTFDSFSSKTSFHSSLGADLYHSLMHLGENQKVILLGNSSSLVKEAPFYPCRAILVGARQDGRQLSSNTIASASNSKDIYDAIKTSIDTFSYKKPLDNPYFHPCPVDSTVSFIKQYLDSNSPCRLMPFGPLQ